jgi:hypothetical protein
MAKKQPRPAKPAKRLSKPVSTHSLLGELGQLIEAAREQTAHAVNSTLVTRYWQIGKRIREDVLRGERASYGDEIVSALSRQLTAEYGRVFTRANLFHMIRFAEVFPDEGIVSALRRQLCWTHFKELIYLDDALKREFYAELCRVERWSTRTLRHKIAHLLYERTAVSKRPETLIAKEIATLRDEDRLTPTPVFPWNFQCFQVDGTDLWRWPRSRIFISHHLGSGEIDASLLRYLCGLVHRFKTRFGELDHVPCSHLVATRNRDGTTWGIQRGEYRADP